VGQGTIAEGRIETCKHCLSERKCAAPSDAEELPAAHLSDPESTHAMQYNPQKTMVSVRCDDKARADGLSEVAIECNASNNDDADGQEITEFLGKR
jgi:hypothetical protein